MQNTPPPPICLHDWPCTYLTLLIISSGDFMLAEDCSVTNLTQTLDLNTAPRLGMINSAPRFWLGLLDSEADYWIVWDRPSPKLFAKYSNVENKGLNYFCSRKSTFTVSKTLRFLLPPSPYSGPLPKTSWVLLGFLEASDLGAGESLWGRFTGRHQVAQCPLLDSLS